MHAKNDVFFRAGSWEKDIVIGESHLSYFVKALGPNYNLRNFSAYTDITSLKILENFPAYLIVLALRQYLGYITLDMTGFYTELVTHVLRSTDFRVSLEFLGSDFDREIDGKLVFFSELEMGTFMVIIFSLLFAFFFLTGDEFSLT